MATSSTLLALINLYVSYRTAASPSDAHSAQLTDSGPANDQHQGSGPSPTCFTSTSDQNCYGAYDPVAPKVMSPRGVADSSTGPKQRLDIHHYTDLEDEQRTRPKNSLVSLTYARLVECSSDHRSEDCDAEVWTDTPSRLWSRAMWHSSSRTYDDSIDVRLELTRY